MDFFKIYLKKKENTAEREQFLNNFNCIVNLLDQAHLTYPIYSRISRSMYKSKSKLRANISVLTIKETPTNRSKSWLVYKSNGQNYAQISSKISRLIREYIR